MFWVYQLHIIVSEEAFWVIYIASWCFDKFLFLRSLSPDMLGYIATSLLESSDKDAQQADFHLVWISV